MASKAKDVRIKPLSVTSANGHQAGEKLLRVRHIKHDATTLAKNIDARS